MSLAIRNLSINLGEHEIVHNLSMDVYPGKIHVLMGPNGSGKSTIAGTLMGSPDYSISGDNVSITINNKNIRNIPVNERSKAGLFLAFQNPVAIPGVSAANLLRTAYQLRNQKENAKKAKHTTLSVWQFNEELVKKANSLNIPQEFLRRSLNEEFSGGEKKKLEMLQAILLKPKYAIFDEIDTGLDVDALKIVASGISELKKSGTGVLIITHYQRILKYAKPDFVHVLVKGRLVEEGTAKLAKYIETYGYKKWNVTNDKIQMPNQVPV